MYISPTIALIIDTGATLLCQSGYVIQKKGHQSVENFNARQTNEHDRKSGFITCTWVIGFSISCVSAALHASKYPHLHMIK